jgi:nicotinamide-nucleotide amidase
VSAQGLVTQAKSLGLTLATAESCTGGLLAAAITGVPGASAVFGLGVVTYANAAKTAQLGVDEALLAAQGAVCGEVAVAMAEGVKRLAAADFAVAITGIAGPDGGSEDKPVGTVWFGLTGPDGSSAHHRLFTGDRDAVRAASVAFAIGLLGGAL